jgi:protein gp37
MGETTGIAWTDSTFNGWVGCARVSPGCTNCYAEALDKRFGGGLDPADGVKKLRWGATAPRIRTSAANWRKPLQWNNEAAAFGERRRVFCSSLSDVFEDRPELVEWRADLFQLIANTPCLDWQLLTKRPENIRRLWPSAIPDSVTPFPNPGPSATLWPNVWLGCTVEDQQRADERLPHLLAVPAAVHFISCEPLLERVQLDLHGIDWVIVGGESGPGARQFDLDWARDIRDQANNADIVFFFKQAGDRPVDAAIGGLARRLGRHGADPALWPAGLNVQEFPRGRA